MTTEALNRDLEQIGQMICRWQAEWWAAFWIAILLGCLWLFGMTDIFWHYEAIGRILTWSVLVVLAAAGVWWLTRILARKPGIVAVAARIERAFPELDNRLINFVQFAARHDRTPLVSAYLRSGVPQWGQIDLKLMKDRKRHWLAYAVLAAACLMMVLPAFWSGPAWANALCRILNPFSSRPASTLAVIVDVQPRNSTVNRGTPLTMTVKVKGKSRQQVWLDLWPADDKKSVVKLGALKGGEVEEFSYIVPKVATGLKYRFRAGDARSEQYEVIAVPPLALTKLTVTVTPPEYTHLKERTVDGLTEEVAIPQGANVKIAIQSSRALASAAIRAAGRQEEPMKSTGKGDTWEANLPVYVAEAITIAAVDAQGGKLSSALKFQLQPDRPPVIRVIAPASRVLLTTGATPSIQWEVSDDYGLTRAYLEQVPLETDNATVAGALVQEWPVKDERRFSTLWTGQPVAAATGKSVGYRIVALDNATFGGAQRSVSPLIVFEMPSAEELAKENKKAAGDTAATLEKMVILQRDNLKRTLELSAVLGSSTVDQWKSAGQVQTTIYQMAGQLLANPFKPLGSLSESVKQIYESAMFDVIAVLEHLPKAEPPRKVELANSSIALETRILRVLTSAQASIKSVEQHRQITGLLALLDALVSGQDAVLTTTRALPAKGGSVAKDLVRQQDKLGSDVSEFVQSCRRESQNLEHADAEFAKLVVQVADQCEARKVSADMLRASEQLEKNQPADAVPFQERALAALKEFQALLNKWRIQEAEKKLEEMAAAMDKAREKWDKLVKLQAKIAEGMRAVEQQKDADKDKKEEFQEELGELKKNVEDAALQVANDLHIFPDLPIQNELVQDIEQIFEDTKQEPGSDKAAATEIGLQKEDFILDQLEKKAERMDDMEMWLPTKPDTVKRLTENFDKQELPQIAKIPNPKELNDIVGDLLKQEEDIAKKLDHSATNQGAPDNPNGWDAMEGEWSNFSAKGVSGNNAPKHNEQTGRGLVGRQGQANGETVAGSGTINEGDNKIEARRTRDPAQSGRVQTDGKTDAKATGGGKQSGVTDERGMPGAGPRRDSDQPGDETGMQAMLRRNAEELYAKASLMHIRTGSLDEAVRYLREAEEAMRDNRPIQQVRELQHRAIAALKKTQGELGSNYVAEPQTARSAPSLDDQLAGPAEEAPANYRDLVADYFKSLNRAQ